MLKFEEIPFELMKNGEILAEATANYEFLSEMTKTILAENSPIEGTEGFKDREARMSEAYKTHLLGVKEARHAMLVAKTRQEALSARFSWFQSMNANRRAETKLI